MDARRRHPKITMKNDACHLSLPMLRAALVAACMCVAAFPQSITVQQLAARTLKARVFAKAESVGGGRSRLSLAREGVRLSLEVPVNTIADATLWEDRVFLACEAVPGAGQIRAILCNGEQLVPEGEASLGDRVPCRIAYGAGVLAVLTTAREIWVANCDGQSLPSVEQWRLAVPASELGSRVTAMSGFGITGDGRISLRIDMADRRLFERRGDNWLRVVPGRPVPGSVEVAGPVVSGRPLSYRASEAGPLFLELEGAGSVGQVPNQHGQGWQVLPGSFTAVMQRGQRYRIRSLTASSDWFAPVALRGESWSAHGYLLDDIAAADNWARVERGMVTFRAQLTVPSVNACRSIRTIGLVSCSPTCVPDVVNAFGRDWLNPTSVIGLDQPVLPKRSQYALAVPVATVRSTSSVGSWIHCQLVALDERGNMLGTTGIRSVLMLPDTGRISQVHEDRLRAQVNAMWRSKGLSVHEFWTLMGVR